MTSTPYGQIPAADLERTSGRRIQPQKKELAPGASDLTFEDLIYSILHPSQTKDRETGEWKEITDPEPTPTQRYRYGDLMDRYGLSFDWNGNPHFPGDVGSDVWGEYYARSKGITQSPAMRQWGQDGAWKQNKQ